MDEGSSSLILRKHVQCVNQSKADPPASLTHSKIHPRILEYGCLFDGGQMQVGLELDPEICIRNFFR